MEIILKKTKITNNILKQCLKTSEEEFIESDILGWCVYNKMRYIVFYNIDTKQLSKYPLFKKTKKFINNRIEVYLEGNFLPYRYQYNSIEETLKFDNIFDNIKEKAEAKGQFFI